MRINKTELKKRIAALDSGDYKQTKGTLQDKNGYCCLGVACKVLIPEKKQQLNSKYLDGSYPYDQYNSPKWLKDISYNFEKKTGVDLASLNDEENFSFPEIATCLELVYIHKMLD